jgi:hypothetical protein
MSQIVEDLIADHEFAAPDDARDRDPGGADDLEDIVTRECWWRG